jgi:spore germination protein YaaH
LDLPIEPRKKHKRRNSGTWILSILLLILIGGGTWYAYGVYEEWKEAQPNLEREEPSFGSNPKPVFYAGEMLQEPAVGSGDALMLTVPFIQEHIDSRMIYEEQSESVIITTTNKVIRMKTDQLTAWVNEKPITLEFPVVKSEEDIQVPVAAIQSLYAFELRENTETGAVLLFKQGDILQWASIKQAFNKKGEPVPVALRTKATIKAPILADLPAEEPVLIWSEEDDWFRVQRSNGWIGYVQKTDAELMQPEMIAIKEQPEPVIPWSPMGGKINLTWEQVVSKNPDTSKIGTLPGLNVISPTWFHLEDDEGNLKNLASASYVKWAHERGYQVWALFSNDFDPDRTKKVLSNYDTRMHVIRQLVSYAQLYDLQGINIDFENVYLADKGLVTQFVRELTPFLHEQGLVVSIDVTIRGGSEMWSLFLDREALGQTVDYMMVMTYDEHWASSPNAGSVASLPWTEKGIADIIKHDHVPASKLLVGVPYYTRIWTEQTVDGKKKVSSKAVGMETIQKLIKDKKLAPVYDEATGQDYVEYKEDGGLKRIWIENDASMKARAELVKKYDLAGIASWRRGFETSNIWETIQSTLESRP